MQTVHEYIKAEENRYQIMPVPIVEGYMWLMFEHVRLTTLYLNSQYRTGTEDNKPFRNIILPKVNLEHRAVQFDLNDIQFYINSEDEDYKSFLVRKWHERWALQNDLSDFLDKLSETYTDYGGVLVKNTQDALEVVPFQRLAFVDQTDMMSGPICEKHEYSPDQLKEMESKGWGNEANGATGSIDELIALSREEKTNTQTQGGSSVTIQPKAKTPGRYIEVYELHGMLPETFLDPEGDENKFIRQMHIVTFYNSKDNPEKQGITLFAGKEKESLYKAFKRDEIYGRALGRGAVEELFEPQVWVNYAEIAKTAMLDQASKVIYQTADQSFKARNNTAELENGDVLTYTEGKPLAPLNTSAPNVQAFESAIQTWDDQAQQIAATTDLMAGDTEGAANMPAQLGIPLIQEGHSLHEYRKKKLGETFLTQIYRDWVIPKMVKAVSQGAEFMSELSLDEMGEVVDQVVNNRFNESIIKKVLAGEIVYPEQAQAMQDAYRQQFYKTNRKFIKILEGELKDLPIEMQVSFTKNNPGAIMAGKLSQIFTQVTQVLIANPNFFVQQPQMAKLFNELLESYGLSELNFRMNDKAPLPQPKNAKSSLTQQNAQPQIQSQPQAAGQNLQ